MQNGFDDSGIRMNTWIAKKDKWTLAELEERSEYLMGRALPIWTAPVTEYKPEEKQLDTYTLDDEGELTGRLIAKFTFKNTEQSVMSWVEMMQQEQRLYLAEVISRKTRLPTIAYTHIKQKLNQLWARRSSGIVATTSNRPRYSFS